MVCFGAPPSFIELKTLAVRDGERLRLDFVLNGEVAKIQLPPPDAKAERRDGLWEATCFEVFLSEAQQGFYWELNASPALHWNFYHFRGYREGRKVEARIPPPRIEVVAHRADAFHLRAELDLSRILGPRALLEIGVTAVLESAGSKTYWALAHLGDKPDFHLRRSFQLRL